MENLIDCNQMILNTFGMIEKETLEKNNKIFQIWKKVVLSIKNNGQKLYEHSSIIDLKNGILLIESDHSGWIQLLQLNSRYIINGFKMYANELGVKTLAFRLKGSEAKLHSVDSDEIYKKEMQKKINEIEKDEQILAKYDKKVVNSNEKSELPQKLLDKFESLKQSLLTKNQK